MPYSSYSKDTNHYVQIDEMLCNGCVICMKACPTKAIRIKDARVARVEGVCIDCGECVRVCPKGAIKAITPESSNLEEPGVYSVSASTVIYSQFDEGIMPNDVLLALKKMGFKYVHDQSYTNEMFNIALQLYIQENREKNDSLFPLISPVCPVVIRLIAHRFPSLLQHIPPLDTPRELVAREAKKRLSKKYGCNREDVKVLHITPCPAKRIYDEEFTILRHSYMDRTIGICEIIENLNENIRKLDEDTVLHHSGGIGLGWGMSGGEIGGLNSDCLAVSGLHETIKYLEKIEIGLLHDIDYIEFRTCTEGCLGGPYTVVDKYQAKHNLQKLIRIFGMEKRVKYEYVKKLYDNGWFFIDKQAIPQRPDPANLSISEGIERQTRVEKILKSLDRKECGICGSPDCRTFAEDVADGKVSLDDCIYIKGQTGKK